MTEINVSSASLFEGGCPSGVLKAIQLDVFILKEEDASYLFGFPVFLEKSEFWQLWAYIPTGQWSARTE